MTKEDHAMRLVQMNALNAIIYLPDYLIDEVTSETGYTRSEESNEFMPGYMYAEQMLRMFPKEITSKLKIAPAFEETFMKWEEGEEDV